MNINDAELVTATIAQIDHALRDVSPRVESLRVLVGQMLDALTEARAVRRRDNTFVGKSVDAVHMDLLLQSLENVLHGSINRLRSFENLVEHASRLQSF